MEKLTWRGSPGMGDIMWALNCAHLHAFEENKRVNLEMHWPHGPDHLHHFEDPETMIQRMEYIHNFYHRKSDVEVTHVFNSNDRYSDWKFEDDLVLEADGTKRQAAFSTHYNKARFWFESGKYNDAPGNPYPRCDWLFRKDAYLPTQRNKVVIWRPLFNAETPRTWKRLLTNKRWDRIISLLRQGGLYVVELTYRTPISEAMYHINTARMCISYDGMWHYIGRNFCTPMFVVSDQGITTYHTPNAVMCEPDPAGLHNIMWWVGNIPNMLGHCKQKSIKWRERLQYIYEDPESKDRQSSN